MMRTRAYLMPRHAVRITKYPLRTRPPAHDGGPGLPPPRFGMRGLWAAMTLLCVLFSLMAAVSAAVGMVILLLVSLGAVHIAGNALGSRLRDGTSASLARLTVEQPPINEDHWPRGSRGLEADGPAGPQPAARAGGAAEATRRGYQNRLRHRAPLGRVHYVWAGLGAVAAGIAGCVLLAAFLWTRLSAAALVLGTLSVATLGGMIGFLGSCLCHVVRQAVRDAVGDCGRSA